MAYNIPDIGSQKPVDTNRINTEKTVNKVTKTEPTRFFTTTEGELKLDRRRTANRRAPGIDRRLLKTTARANASIRRKGARDRRRNSLSQQKTGSANKSIGKSIDRNV
ncbi:MAG: hypothetical protein KUG53_00220 [Pseudomonadales bacterium]|nr:hypothetical protein [Pseudomonadales bacterium]